MNSLRPEVIGVLPAGALGVSLFHHLTRGATQLDNVRLLERPGSPSSAALRQHGFIEIETAAGNRRVPTATVMLPEPVRCYREGTLPGTLLICTNPDQLLEIVTQCVRLLELAAEAGELEAGSLPFPTVVLCSNGIYFQRIRQIFVEKLEEATLFGRLPDLWPDLMPAIVGRWLRGVSIQTGVRDGVGAEAVYRPGPPGITRIAGGLSDIRGQVVKACVQRGAWFEDAGKHSPTRIEFDKALVNLASNLLGLLRAIDTNGRFRRLKVAEIATGENRAAIDRLAREVFRVGQAVRAYNARDQVDDLIAGLHRTLQLHAGHVPSSIQWVDVALRRGHLQPALTPTEKWLLEPLVRYAEAAGLEQTAAYFRSLEAELIESLGRAIRRSGEE